MNMLSQKLGPLSRARYWYDYCYVVKDRLILDRIRMVSLLRKHLGCESQS